MKIILDINKEVLFKKQNATPIQAQSQITNPQQTQTTKLPNFDSIGRSLVTFKSAQETNKNDKENDFANLSKKTIKELEELKILYSDNQKEIEKLKKTARDNLKKIEEWNPSKAYDAYSQAAMDEIRGKGLSTFWNPFRTKRIKSAYMDEYYKKEREINKLKQRKEADEIIINSTPLNKKQIELLIGQIDTIIGQKREMEKQKTRIESLDKVQDSINAMSNRKGGLNDIIAGYEYEKDQINKMFVEPLCKSMDDPEVKVPASVLLHGATGTGKTSFLNSIGYQSKDYAKIIDYSSESGSENFLDTIKGELKNARRRYLEEDENGNPKKTRTILLINEAEKFLSMSPKEAKILYQEGIFDEMDFEHMENYGQSTDYINQFKTLLDTCSQAPTSNSDTSRGAMTIFITTNYPHLIHPDLLTRDGKMPYIAINPAEGKNIEKVIKHYFKKAHNLTEDIKAIEDCKDLKKISGLSRKAVINLEEMITKGTVNKLNIDYENIPYDKYAEEFKPTLKKGAFSNDNFRKIAEKAVNMYFENPEHTFEYYFLLSLIKEDSPKKLFNGTTIESSRDINPQRYKKFITIYNMLAPADVEEKETLLRMERMNIKDEKAKKRLAIIRVMEATELKNLKEKEAANILTDNEKERLAYLRTQDNKVDISLDENEDY